MKKMLRSVCLLLGILLTGCATRSIPQTLYDLGPLPTAAAGAAPLPPLALADPVGSAFLDSPMMFYRLAYANDQQPKAYAESRWSMPPAQLLGQRFKARLGQSGSSVISAGDGAVNVPLIRLEADDFSQSFDSASHSTVRVTLRVAVFNNRVLLAQKSFAQQRAAASADAIGGARALADASDALITDVVGWLGTLALPKR